MQFIYFFYLVGSLEESALKATCLVRDMMYSMLVARQADTQPYGRRRPLLNLNAVQYCLDLDKRRTIPTPPKLPLRRNHHRGQSMGFHPHDGNCTHSALTAGRYPIEGQIITAKLPGKKSEMLFGALSPSRTWNQQNNLFLIWFHAFHINWQTHWAPKQN